MTWDQVNFKERLAIIETKGKGKNPVYRQLRLSEKAMKVLDVLSRDSTGHPALIFDGQRVFDLTNRRRHWEKARKLLGIEKSVTWHGIRHSFGTETTRRAKAGDKLVGKMLGHAPGTNATQRYIHVMADDVYEALEHLPDIGLPLLASPQKTEK